MKQTDGSDEAKRRAGAAAAQLPEDGDVVGVGTGSTAAHAIRTLGDRVDAGLDIRGVPTSYQSRALAREAGIPLTTLDDDTVDIAIDGADQIDDAGRLVKGGGAAHAREKLVDTDADRFVVVADPTKLVEELDCPVPVELLPDARRPVMDAVEQAGGEPTLRTAERKDGPVVTDNGNLVLDCAFGTIDTPSGVARRLETTPGVVEHGLFVGLVDEVHVGSEDGVERLEY
jgi:ribose 5-phosphate isomerase A